MNNRSIGFGQINQMIDKLVQELVIKQTNMERYKSEKGEEKIGRELMEEMRANSWTAEEPLNDFYSRKMASVAPNPEDRALRFASDVFEAVLQEFTDVAEQDYVLASLLQLFLDERHAVLRRLENQAKEIQQSLEHL